MLKVMAFRRLDKTPRPGAGCYVDWRGMKSQSYLPIFHETLDAFNTSGLKR